MAMVRTYEIVEPATSLRGLPPPVLSVKALSKLYGSKRALNDVSFDVRKGEVFGLLGPNGAGKTTTLEIIEGLRSFDAGEIEVFGLPHASALSAIRQRIGVSLQKSEYWGKLRVRELVDLFRGFYANGLSRGVLLDMFSLGPLQDIYLKNLSGGQRQRLVLCLALVNDPELIILDEPTIGLDPEARRGLWSLIRGFVREGRSVILTTHYMDEAQALSDRVAILHEGGIRCCGTPSELIARMHSERAVIFENAPADLEELQNAAWCAGIARGDKNEAIVYSTELSATLFNLIELAKARDMPLEKLSIREPNLEDVFLHVTRSS